MASDGGAERTGDWVELLGNSQAPARLRDGAEILGSRDSESLQGQSGRAVDAILRQTGRAFLDSCELEEFPGITAAHTMSAGAAKGAQKTKPLNIAVLLSGGVDSSLALYLLHKVAKHNVTAFYLQIWFQEDFRNTWDACPWEEDLEYCQRVCKALDVPLKTVPLTAEYWDRVVEHSIGEVRAGRTPNPDMLCNSRVKFGAFYEYLENNHADSFDRVASGHYASKTADGLLKLTPDAIKDQTYFLANLSPEQLQKAMFPLGCFDKKTVRELATLADLPTKGRKDSQGICFLGKVKFDEFIKEHLGEWPGPLVEAETGEVVGYHDGYWFYTVGQRKGIGLPGGPWFVVEKDATWNAVYISRSTQETRDSARVEVEEDRRNRTFDCVDINWHAGDAGTVGDAGAIRCKVRHGPHLYGCESIHTLGDNSLRITLDAPDQGLAAGQYAVLYDCLDRCIACGVIRLLS
jgi:tRNA (5-methylaminomethyl-2-thiouridylate)-methyltransferase